MNTSTGISIIRLITLVIISGSAWIRPLVGTAATPVPVSLLVWYPGGGGSAELAAPLMERWADYLGQQISGTHWTIFFAGTEAEGRRLWRTKQPTFVLPSHLMRVREALDGPVIASSIPALLGKRTEHWRFVHNQCAQPTTNFSSEPIDKLFIGNLFPTFSVKTPLESTNNLVGVLRRMQGGECIGAYLNEREWTNSTRALAHLTKTLVAETAAHLVPTPTVMARRTGADAALGARLRTALTTMQHDATGQAILQELQLTRFE